MCRLGCSLRGTCTCYILKADREFWLHQGTFAGSCGGVYAGTKNKS